MSTQALGTVVRCCLVMLMLGLASLGWGQATVRGQVLLIDHARKNKKTNSANVVLWLTPKSQPVSHADLVRGFRLAEPLRLVQTGKAFHPHILVVPAGAVVEFPNHDPFFHNVFSLFEGKRFDLGLYEAGTTRRVHFDRPGISYIFCNIHAQMSAVVIALDTPYYAISRRSGEFSIPDVPPGSYELQVWYEGSTADVLKALARTVTISQAGLSLAAIHVVENTSLLPHKNKYGQDYDPTTYDPLYQPQQNQQ